MKDVTELDLADVLGALLKTGETPQDIPHHLQCYYNEEAANESYDSAHRAAALKRAELVEEHLF